MTVCETIWLNLGRKYSSEHILLLLSAFTSLLSTSDPVTATHAHIHHVCQIMWYALDHEPFLSFSVFVFTHQTAPLTIKLGFICTKNLSSELGRASGLCLEIKPLYLHS